MHFGHNLYLAVFYIMTMDDKLVFVLFLQRT